MNAPPQSAKPELAAHQRRVAGLLSRLAKQLPAANPPDAYNAALMCSEFDEAVEFAAYERISITDATAAFLAENSLRAQTDLKTIVTPQNPFSPSELPVMPRAI